MADCTAEAALAAPTALRHARSPHEVANRYAAHEALGDHPVIRSMTGTAGDLLARHNPTERGFGRRANRAVKLGRIEVLEPDFHPFGGVAPDRNTQAVTVADI